MEEELNTIVKDLGRHNDIYLIEVAATIMRELARRAMNRKRNREDMDMLTHL